MIERAHFSGERTPYLVIGAARRTALTRECVRVGRARENDVVIDDARVSRRHVELRWLREVNRYLIVDVGSSGGTRLNGYAIRQCTLEHGDVIELGGCAIRYEDE
jgi:pSer/pThr/pTyr-binding forkhead associated (FHA) protein